MTSFDILTYALVNDKPTKYDFEYRQYYCIPIDLSLRIPKYGEPIIIRFVFTIDQQKIYHDIITHAGGSIISSCDCFFLHHLKLLGNENKEFTSDGQSNFAMLHHIKFSLDNNDLVLSSNYIDFRINNGMQFLTDIIAKLETFVSDVSTNWRLLDNDFTNN